MKCLQLARFLREDGAVSGNYERLEFLAVALDQRFNKIHTDRWCGALFLMAAGSSRRITSKEIPCPPMMRGWTKQEVQRFVLTGTTPKKTKRKK